MATSPNFSWPEPDNTDLVKNGALAIRTAINAIDTSMVDLKGGTTGQVLSKATNTDMDFSWVAQDDSNAIQNAIVDAKGDIIAASAADTPARLAVGANDLFLTAQSAETTGLKWAGTWTTYTPTVTAATGSITTSSASGRYIQIGKFVFACISATITNNGTGATHVIVTAPKTAVNNSSTALFRENAATGLTGQVRTAGADFILQTLTNTYPGASGYTFIFGIGYEVA